MENSKEMSTQSTQTKLFFDGTIPKTQSSDIECVEDKTCSLKNREWLTAVEAADYLRVSLGSLRNLTCTNKIPSYKLGKRVRYRVCDLREHLLANKRGGDVVWVSNSTHRSRNGKRLFQNAIRFRVNQSR